MTDLGFNLTPIVHKQKITLKDLKGKRLAVDANNTLYQFLALLRSRDGTPLQDRRGNVTSHLAGLLFRTTRLMADYDVRPVFVFDGKPPALKQETMAARRAVRDKASEEYARALRAGDYAKAWSKAVVMGKLSQSMIQDAKRLLGILGIPFVQAPSEGEAQAAYMARKSDAWAANSRDYDSILFGAPRLVRYVTIAGQEFLPSRGVVRPLAPELIERDKLLNYLGISLQQLVDVAILVGTDFNKGARGVGPKTAVRLIKAHGSIENLPENIRSPVSGNYVEVRSFFLSPPVHDDYRIEYAEPDESELFEFLCGERDFSRERVVVAADRMRQVWKRWSDAGLKAWLR